MDHLAPWVFVAVLAIGWLFRIFTRLADRLARDAARAAGRPGQGAAPFAVTPRPPAAPPLGSPPAARPSQAGPVNPRVPVPTRRVPLTAQAPGLSGPAAGAPGTSGRAVGAALRSGSGLRNAVVLAEVLAPPVGLR